MRRLLHRLVRLYPPAFRRRYAQELHDLIDELGEHQPGRLWQSLPGLVGGVVAEWWRCSPSRAVAAVAAPVAGVVVALAAISAVGGAPGAGTSLQSASRPVAGARVETVPHVYGTAIQGQACLVGIDECGGTVCSIYVGSGDAQTTEAVTPAATPGRCGRQGSGPAAVPISGTAAAAPTAVATVPVHSAN